MGKTKRKEKEDKSSVSLDDHIRQILYDEFDTLMATDGKAIIEEKVREQLELMQEEKEIQKLIANAEEQVKQDRQTLLEQITIIQDRLSSLVDSSFIFDMHPTINLANGRSIGLGFASHLMRDPGNFKLLGFAGYNEFFKWPRLLRNEFCEMGKQIVEDILGESYEKESLDLLEKKMSCIQKELKRLKNEIKKKAGLIL